MGLIRAAGEAGRQGVGWGKRGSLGGGVGWGGAGRWGKRGGPVHTGINPQNPYPTCVGSKQKTTTSSFYITHLTLDSVAFY